MSKHALDEVLFDIQQCEDVLCEANTDPHDYALAKAGIHHLWRARCALKNDAPDTGYRQRCLAYAAMNAVRSDSEVNANG